MSGGRGPNATVVNLTALAVVIGSAVVAWLWDPIYGPALWAVGWGLAAILGIIVAVTVGASRSRLSGPDDAGPTGRQRP